MKWNLDNVIIEIKQMKLNFQAGVDAVYNAVVDAGGTPASNSLADIVEAIHNLTGVTIYLYNGKVATDESVYIDADLSENIETGTTLLLSMKDEETIVNEIHTYTGGEDDFTIGSGYYSVKLTAGTIGLSYYAGPYRNIYMTVSKIDPSQLLS